MKTLGSLCNNSALGYGARVCDPQRTGLHGDVLRLTEPRSVFAEVASKVAQGVNTMS